MDVGTIELYYFKEVRKHTFLDYLNGGEQLNMAVAIDYTGSNGAPKLLNSKHHIG